MRSIRRRQETLSDVEMNLTPLIDVCFVVLIMFIVVAPILEMERVELAAGPPLDQQNILAVKEQGAITIHVYKNNTIALNQQQLPLNQLHRALSIAKTKTPTARPQIFHDRNATFGTYQAVKNAVEQAGFTDMDLILKPE